MVFKVLPPLFVGVFFIVLYYLAKIILERQAKGKSEKGLIKSIVLFLIVLIGLISVILSLPLGDQKNAITSLIGIVLSAVLALSSTTFIGNALAGIMLKILKNFKPGDFITVNNVFGRVTEQGLFHTEVQTAERDLTTLPNMSLVTNSVKVTRSSGTFISAEVSLGYDVPRKKIEKALIQAALTIGLSDPFVHIMSIGDFSVVYKIHGLLLDVKSILSARSNLFASVMDELHGAGIEIVSPTFMNQRQVAGTVFIPNVETTSDSEAKSESPEILIFDKAEKAESLEKRKAMLSEIELKIKSDQEAVNAASTDEDKVRLKEKLEATKVLKEKLVERIDEKIDEISKNT